MFKNPSSESAELSWVNPDSGQPKFITRIDSGAQHSESTFIGHEFEVKLGRRTEKVKVENSGSVDIRSHQFARNWDPLVSQEQQDSFAASCVADLEKARDEGVDPTAVEEDAEVFCRKFPVRQHVYERQTVKTWPDDSIKASWRAEERIIRTQPQAFHNYTQRGFRLLSKAKGYKHMLNESFIVAHRRMTDWYEENRKHAQPEAAKRYGSVLSAYENDNFVIRPPEHMINEVAAEVAKALEDWAGLERGTLEQTAVYGIRMYRRNAQLRSHVDKWETHVLSAILSIGQRGLSTPWPLEIRDHNGAWHNVKDKAGDVVLYESTTCEHGRSTKLQGREFANIFMHFRPRTGWGPKYPDLIAHENVPGSRTSMKFEL